METKCKIKKDQIPICKILGVDIAAINMNWLIDFTEKNIDALSGEYICVSNVHTTVLSYENEIYRNVQNGAIMAIPDGGPLSSVGRKRGFKSMKRTTGPDYMQKVFEISVDRGYKHFFLGSTDETLVRLKQNLIEKYPGIDIVGTLSPPFREISKEEDAEITFMINNTAADFVWIGLGAPKQEMWMAQHKGLVQGLMVGVGAAFDYFAGNLKRAPKWMQKLNLEWFYRFCQEPKRLFKRYFYSNPKFIWNAMIHKR